MATLINYKDIQNKGLFDYYVCSNFDLDDNILSLRFVEDYNKGLSKILSNAGYQVTFCGCKAIEYTHPDYIK